jgi:hypothetical protein
MEGHARTWFTPKQRAELWERWKSGQCVAAGGAEIVRFGHRPHLISECSIMVLSEEVGGS